MRNFNIIKILITQKNIQEIRRFKKNYFSNKQQE